MNLHYPWRCLESPLSCWQLRLFGRWWSARTRGRVYSACRRSRCWRRHFYGFSRFLGKNKDFWDFEDLKRPMGFRPHKLLQLFPRSCFSNEHVKHWEVCASWQKPWSGGGFCLSGRPRRESWHRPYGRWRLYQTPPDQCEKSCLDVVRCSSWLLDLANCQEMEKEVEDKRIELDIAQRRRERESKPKVQSNTFLLLVVLLLRCNHLVLVHLIWQYSQRVA